MKTSKRVLAMLLAVAMMLCVFAGCGTETASSAADSTAEVASGETATDTANTGDKVVKIGVYEPASGDNGAGGKQETLGMQYANKVQPTASDVFKNGGVPAIGVTCTNPQVTEGNEHYFRICFLDPFQGTVLANFASSELGAKKAYCLSKLGDDYSAGLCNYFKEAFTALGGEVVEESFPEGNSDFTSYVTNAKSQGCDVFFAPVSTEAAANIIEQASAQNLGIPMLAGDTWDSNVITGAAQGKSVEIYVTTFYQEGGNADFDKGFKEYLNSDATALANNGGNDMVAAVSAMGYDAYFVALEALKAAGSTDPGDVMKALPSVNYTGVTGVITFNETGDANRDTAYVKKVNTETGAWDFVAEQKVS